MAESSAPQFPTTRTDSDFFIYGAPAKWNRSETEGWRQNEMEGFDRNVQAMYSRNVREAWLQNDWARSSWTAPVPEGLIDCAAKWWMNVSWAG